MREAYPNELYHHGILGMRWGVRRYQTLSGALTRAGRERYLKARNDRIYSEKQQQLALKEDKDRIKQAKIENRIENRRARLENQRLRLENKYAKAENTHKKIENLDYLTTIKRGKSTKSYRDPRDGKPEDTKSSNQNNGGNNQNQNQNNGGNNQNQNAAAINAITARDLNNIDYSKFSTNDLQQLVNRLGNEQKLNEIYKQSIPPSKAEKAVNFVEKNGERASKLLKITLGIAGTVLAYKAISKNVAGFAEGAKKAAEATGNAAKNVDSEKAKAAKDAAKNMKDAFKNAGLKLPDILVEDFVNKKFGL